MFLIQISHDPVKTENDSVHLMFFFPDIYDKMLGSHDVNK